MWKRLGNRLQSASVIDANRSTVIIATPIISRSGAFELFIATMLIGAAASFAYLPPTVEDSDAPAATPRAA
jgi:hypothetical protein